MVKLEHVEWMDDWFALDNDGTSVEGTYEEWLAILDSMGRKEARAFTRVSVQRGEGRFLFASPRNSVRASEACVEDFEVEAFIVQARGVLAAWRVAQESTSTVMNPPAVADAPDRRRDMNQWTLAEHLCRTATLAVESMGADEHLTRAVTFLGKAKDAIADSVEKAPTPTTTWFTEGHPVDLRTLQRMNEARVPAFKKELADWSAMEWGCELGEEVGEFMGSVLFLGSALSKVLGAVKKRARVPHPTLPDTDITGKPVPTTDAVASELADVVIVACLLASRLGIDLNNAVRTKWNATSEKVGWKERL